MSTSSDTSAPTKTATYNGSCHCERVKFTVKTSPPVEESKILSCNCSICTKNGLNFVNVSDSNVEWHSGFDDMTPYKFGKQRLQHSFCPSCGTNVYAKSVDPNFYPGMAGINIRTLEGVDLDTLNYTKFDGKSL